VVTQQHWCELHKLFKKLYYCCFGLMMAALLLLADHLVAIGCNCIAATLGAVQPHSPATQDVQKH
jgi:hypothetical protein